MPNRKLLFLVFADDACRQNHALRHALDLRRSGHEVKLVLEGQATRMLSQLGGGSATGGLLAQARAEGIVAGACARASAGCSSGDPARDVAQLARAAGIALLSDLDGHAAIEPFVREGYEIVTF